MRRLLIGPAVAVLGLFVVSAAAQEYVFPLFAGGYKDEGLPPHPCGARGVKQIATSTFDRTMVVFYLCGDDAVQTRRFFRTITSPTVPESPSPVKAHLDAAQLSNGILSGGGWAVNCEGVITKVEVVLSGLTFGSIPVTLGGLRPDVHAAAPCAPMNTGFDFNTGGLLPELRPLHVQVIAYDEQGRRGYSNVITVN